MTNMGAKRRIKLGYDEAEVIMIETDGWKVNIEIHNLLLKILSGKKIKNDIIGGKNRNLRLYLVKFVLIILHILLDFL